MLPSMSFIVTALNEERTIEATVLEIHASAMGYCNEYEIILVNDGSVDQTGMIMDRLASGDKRIRVIHNEKNLNLGGAYKRGLKDARLDYVIWLPGDNAAPSKTIQVTLSKVGQADIVIPFLNHLKGRSLLRRFISRSYTRLLNLLFGLKLRYYNGIVVHRRELLQSIEITTNSFACFAEALIKLLRNGATYVEVGYDSTQRKVAYTNAFRLKNVINVIKTILYLYWVCVLCSKPRNIPGPSIPPIKEAVTKGSKAVEKEAALDREDTERLSCRDI
jgi:dolichol-phosphate mannosyltransferase